MDRTTYVLSRLRDDIRNGVIEPGSSIRQIELGARYGVSATPVREALRRLEAEGVIVYSAHRGATLREMTIEDAQDLVTMRAELEGLATRVAIYRISTDVIEQLREIHDAMDREVVGSAVSATLAQLNRDFHFVLYDAGSRVIAAQIRSLWAMNPPGDSNWAEEPWVTASLADHDAIIHAIEAGDPDAGRALMSAHIFRAADRSRQASFYRPNLSAAAE